MIGLTDSWSGSGRPLRVVYDRDRVIAAIMEQGGDGMSYEEAVEHFDFNIAGAYVGDRTPVFVDRIDDA